MSESITGYHTTAQTLSPTRPLVNISGTIDATGPAGTYHIETFQDSFAAALFGPAAGSFDITNNGLIEARPATVSVGSTDFNYGILLGGSGHITNLGTIIGAGGIAAVGNHSSYIKNSNQITGTTYYGIGLFNGADTVVNGGSIQGHEIGVELASGGFVSNVVSGFISSLYGAAVAGNGHAIVENAGTISGSTGVILLGNQGLVINTGIIDNLNAGPLAGSYAGVVGYGGGTITNSGTISGATGIILTGGGTITDAGLIEGDTYAVQFTAGFNNLLIVESGETFVGGVAGGNTIGGAARSVLELGAGGGSIAGLGSEITGFQTFAFTAGNTWSAAGNIAGLASGDSITGFAKGDRLTLSDFTAKDGTQTIGANGMLELTNGNETITLNFAAANAGETVEVTPGHTAGTDVALENALCFVEGTKILSANGEVPVEALKPGDLVQTLHHDWRPIIWVGVRSYAGRFIAGNHLALPVRIRQGAIADNIPSRDLVVSPGHGIFIDDVLFPAWRLINGISITQDFYLERISYYHLELAAHEVLFAEGCPSESFLEEHPAGRQQFHNAASFRERLKITHPGKPLPRVEDGFRLQAVQQKLHVRAGILPPVEKPGTLRGYVDQAGPTLVTGWAQCVEEPETPVTLDVFIRGQRVARVLANKYRADLRTAGIGSGCHAFELSLPAGHTGKIDVRRSLDQARLDLTELARVDAA